MPKIQYEEWNPKPETRALGDHCVSIAADYSGRGYQLTLRQLYYQLVARDLIVNTERSYDRVGVIVDRLRMAGLMDWNMIEDRTRGLMGVSHWTTPASVIDSAAYGYRIDKWDDQPRQVEVWVEKQALESIVGAVCREEDVNYFSCRGYASSSAMWRAARRFFYAWQEGKAVTILHLGDHDPSGIDMTRDIEDRLTKFLTVDWVRDNRRVFQMDPIFAQYEAILPHLERSVGERPIEVKRIALNMDQVEQYNPPPNPAKVTDSRYEAYQQLYGTESWELDAIDPDDLSDLIRTHVRGERDDDLYEDRVAQEARDRNVLARLTENWQQVVALLDRLEDEA